MKSVFLALATKSQLVKAETALILLNGNKVVRIPPKVVLECLKAVLGGVLMPIQTTFRLLPGTKLEGSMNATFYAVR